VKTLEADLRECGIEPRGANGERVDFHALRHTFSTLLAQMGVGEACRISLNRHKSWEQTKRYTDPSLLPIHGEMAKLDRISPSLGASLNSAKNGQKSSKLVQMPDAAGPDQNPKVVDFKDTCPQFSKAVPSWENVEMVPEGGLEPPCS